MISTERRGEADLWEAERALAGTAERATLSVDGHRLEVSNLDLGLWPGLTKRDFLKYLIRIGPYLLPHLRNRPIAVTRCPAGVDGAAHFGGEIDERPAWVRTIRVWSPEQDEASGHLLVSDMATLLWLGERCALELFPWLSRIGTLEPEPGTDSIAVDETSGLWFPDFLVVNLDWRRTIRDGAEADSDTDRLAFRRVADVALDLRSVANALGLRAYVKTSGRRGLHCFLPLDRRLNFSEVRVMAEMIGQFLLAVRPRNSTKAMTLLAQSGFISIDHNQNMWGKALVAPYSLRRHPEATVSTPLDWSELENAQPSQFTIHTVPDRVAERGDPWAELVAAVRVPGGPGAWALDRSCEPAAMEAAPRAGSLRTA
jgi:bifunctional non-homologous end joining protein LigD